MSSQPNPPQSHKQYPRWHLVVLLIQILFRILLEQRHLFLPTEPKPLALGSQFELFLTLNQPLFLQSHWTVLPAEPHGHRIAILLLVCQHSIYGVIISLKVKGIYELSDLVQYLIWCLVNGNLFAYLLSKCFFYRPDSGKEQGHLLKLGIAQPLT